MIYDSAKLRHTECLSLKLYLKRTKYYIQISFSLHTETRLKSLFLKIIFKLKKNNEIDRKSIFSNFKTKEKFGKTI